MNTDFRICTAHPPHVAPKRIGALVLRFLFFVICILTALYLRFYLGNLPNHADHVAGYDTIQKTIVNYPSLSWAYSFINPEFEKKQVAIREILTVLEKHETELAAVKKEELAEVIYEEATRHNHDPKFILAFIAIESSFQNWSVSERGAKGLMQIMPYVAESIAQEMGIEWRGDRTLFNPFLNIKMGIHYLSRLFTDFKDPELAVTAYNYGPTYIKGLIEKKGKVPQDFYEKVYNRYRDLIVLTKREEKPLVSADSFPITESPL